MPFVIPDAVIDMFYGTEMGNTEIGDFLLASVNEMVNSAIPTDVLAASGGAVSWLPSFNSFSEFNSSMKASTDLVEASTSSGPMGSQAVTLTQLTNLGMSLQKNLNISKSSAGSRRLWSAVIPASRALRPHIRSDRRAMVTNLTNVTCPSLPKTNSKHNVVSMTISLTPPPSLIAGLGLLDSTEMITLIDLAIVKSLALFKFSKRLSECTGSNLSVIFSSGMTSIAVVIGTQVLVKTAVSTKPASETLNTAIVYVIVGASLPVLMCCIVAWLWRLRCLVCVVRLKKRKPILLVLYEGRRDGLASAAAAALVAEATWRGSLSGWRVSAAPLDDSSLDARLVADAIIMLLAPNVQSEVGAPLICFVHVVADNTRDAQSAKVARAALDASASYEDATSGVLAVADLTSELESAVRTAASIDAPSLRPLRAWVAAMFARLDVLAVAAADAAAKPDEPPNALILVAEFVPRARRSLVLVCDPPLDSAATLADSTDITLGAALLATLLAEAARSDGGAIDGWHVIAAPLLIEDEAARSTRAAADIVLFCVGATTPMLRGDIGRLRLVAMTADARRVALTGDMSVAALNSINNDADNDTYNSGSDSDAAWANSRLLPFILSGKPAALLIRTVKMPHPPPHPSVVAKISAQPKPLPFPQRPSLLMILLPSSPRGSARAVARAVLAEASSAKDGEFGDGALSHWHVSVRNATDSSAVAVSARKESDIVFFIADYCEGGKTLGMALHVLDMGARNASDLRILSRLRDMSGEQLGMASAMPSTDDMYNYLNPSNDDDIDDSFAAALAGLSPSSDRAWVRANVIPTILACVATGATLFADFLPVSPAIPPLPKSLTQPVHMIRSPLPPPPLPPLPLPPLARSPSPLNDMPLQGRVARAPWGISMWKPKNREMDRFPREDAHVVSLVALRRPEASYPNPGDESWGSSASPVALTKERHQVSHPLRTRLDRARSPKEPTATTKSLSPPKSRQSLSPLKSPPPSMAPISSPNTQVQSRSPQFSEDVEESLVAAHAGVSHASFHASRSANIIPAIRASLPTPRAILPPPLPPPPPPVARSPSPMPFDLPIQGRVARAPWGISMWKPKNREMDRFPREDAHVVSLVALRGCLHAASDLSGCGRLAAEPTST